MIWKGIIKWVTNVGLNLRKVHKIGLNIVLVMKMAGKKWLGVWVCFSWRLKQHGVYVRKVFSDRYEGFEGEW